MSAQLGSSGGVTSISSLAQVDGGRFGVGVTGLLHPPFARILVDALSLLFVGAEVLADPCPEFASCAGTTPTHQYLVSTAAGVDHHLTEGTTLALI